MPATLPKAGVSGPGEKWAERKKDPAGITHPDLIPIIRAPTRRRDPRATTATGRHMATIRADRSAGLTTSRGIHTTSRGIHMELPGHMTVRETGILTAPAAGRPSTGPGRRAPTTESAVLTDTVAPSRDTAASSASHMARNHMGKDHMDRGPMEGGKTACSTTTTRPSTR